jgi:hypothetical protein
MTRHPLMEEMRPFVGTRLIESIDKIAGIAARHRCTVNVIDPKFNTWSIDEEPLRLNVRTDNDSVIKMFTIG